MPKLAKIKGQSDAVLDADERNHVRDILGVPNKLGNASFEATETRFDELRDTVALKPLNRLIRAIVAEYDKIGEEMVELQGGSRGIYVKLKDNRARQARNLRAQVFPPDEVIPLDDEPQTALGSSDTVVYSVPINYGNDTDDADEYAS